METYEGRIKDIKFNGKPESCMAEVICRQAIIGVLEDVVIDSGRYNLPKVADLLMAAIIEWDVELPTNPYNELALDDVESAAGNSYSEAQQSMVTAGFRKVKSEGGN